MTKLKKVVTMIIAFFKKVDGMLGEMTQLKDDIRQLVDRYKQLAADTKQAAAPEFTEDTNLRGPRLIFETAAGQGAPPVVYASSFHVYGPAPQGNVGEHSPYGAIRDLSHLSKVYAEKLGEMFSMTRDLPVSPVRLGIVYGVGPVMKTDLRFVTVPHAFCLRALAGKQR